MGSRLICHLIRQKDQAMVHDDHKAVPCDPNSLFIWADSRYINATTVRPGVLTDDVIHWQHWLHEVLF